MNRIKTFINILLRIIFKDDTEAPTDLKQRLEILKKRNTICEQVISELGYYDYETYNYAYRIYDYSAEELNYLSHKYGFLKDIMELDKLIYKRMKYIKKQIRSRKQDITDPKAIDRNFIDLIDELKLFEKECINAK